MSLIERTIRERTHGEPPDRASFGGSDDKWDGYLLGVEEAGAVAADLHRGAVGERDRLREVLRAVLMEPDPIKRNQLAAPVLTTNGGSSTMSPMEHCPECEAAWERGHKAGRAFQVSHDIEAATDRVMALMIRTYGAIRSEETREQAERLARAALGGR